MTMAAGLRSLLAFVSVLAASTTAVAAAYHPSSSSSSLSIQRSSQRSSSASSSKSSPSLSSSSSSSSSLSSPPSVVPSTRSEFIATSAAAAAAAAAVAPFGLFVPSSPANAATTSSVLKPKRAGLSDEELRDIVTADVLDRSFLVTADLTREIYDERSVFIDEIDSYPIDKWIVGTKRLFVPSGSRVSLASPVLVTPAAVEFRFDEDLMFNVPLKPVVSLTGRVVLERDARSGLIVGYREFWDQSVKEVLGTAKFRGKDGSLKKFPGLLTAL